VRTVWLCVLIAVGTLVLCEVGARVLFAFLVGPRVLAYGTGAYGKATHLPSLLMRKVRYTPPTPEQPVGDYLKFAPNELKFDRDEHGERFSPTINRQGFRGADFRPEKEPGVIRVVTLGASSTFGYHNRDDQTYPYYLERELNQRTSELPRFEVLNLGIPHIASDLIVPLLTAEALPLQPDVVTLYAGWNDSGGVRHILQGREQRPAAFELLRRRLLLVAFADSLLFFRLQRFGEGHFEALMTGKRERFRANLTRIRDECAHRGTLLVVATQQAKSTLVSRDQIRGTTYQAEAARAREELRRRGVPRRALVFLVHAELMQELRHWATEENAPLVDIIVELDQDRDVLLTYVHLNPEGNRRVAKALAAAILEGMTPGRETGSPELGSYPRGRDPFSPAGG
jgi:lysophospholipase L1-like esterase